jgi:hypothetical protein
LERFSFGGRVVKLSSGATEALYNALVVLGEQHAGTSDELAVVAYFRRATTGPVRAFGLDPVDEELRASPRLAFLAKLIAELAYDLARATPDARLTDISWSRSLRLSWLANVIELHEMLVDRDPSIETLALHLASGERAEVEANRATNAYARARRRGAVGESIASIDEALAALELAPRDDGHEHRLWSLLSAKAELLEQTGAFLEAAIVLRASADHTCDAELKQLTLEAADELERKR